MNYKKLFCVVVVILLTLVVGCKTKTSQEQISHNELVIYSDLNADFVNALAENFAKETHLQTKILNINNLDGEKCRTDLIISNSFQLNDLSKSDSLSTLEIPTVYKVHHRFRGKNNNWVGVFYDPVVLLIDREYSRKFGQIHLHSWQDLVKTTSPRIVTESFNSSQIQRHLCAAFVSNMGEEKAFNYFANLDKYIIQYTKFPFTPVRMIAAGEADFALTLSSYVFKYLDNDFPAYTLEPAEGTPIILYGVGIFKETDSLSEATKFVNWLLTSNSVKKIMQKNGTGFKLLSAKGTNFVDKLWLNYGYLSEDELNDLIHKWYDRVLFGNEK